MTDQNRKKKAADIPKWSWIVAAVGFALVAGSVGFMLYQAFAGDSSRPKLAVEVEAIMPSGSGHLVQIRVTNSGGSAAAGLTVEGELKEGTTAIESSEVTLDYVPAGSQRRAGLIFSRDPRNFQLQLRAKGYGEP